MIRRKVSKISCQPRRGKDGAKNNVIGTETWKFIGPIQVFDIESANRPRKCDPRDSDKIVARSRASRIAKSPGLMGFRAIYKASFAALFTRQASAPNKGREENLSRNRRAGNLRWNRNETASVEKWWSYRYDLCENLLFTV